MPAKAAKKQDERTAETVEAELQEAREASRALNAEYRNLPEQIDAALDEEDHARVAELRRQRDEMPSRLYTAHRRALRLQAELADLTVEETSGEIGEYGTEAQEKSAKANALRQEADRAAGLAASLRDQRIQEQKNARQLRRDLEALEAGGLDGFLRRIGGREGEPRQPVAARR